MVFIGLAFTNNQCPYNVISEENEPTFSYNPNVSVISFQLVLISFQVDQIRKGFLNDMRFTISISITLSTKHFREVGKVFEVSLTTFLHYGNADFNSNINV